jgi:gluconolactonase
VVKSDGTIWFTDPPYGILSDYEGHKAESELGDCYVFRFDPLSQELSIVTDEIDYPNGLAFSPDEEVLYIADTSPGFDPKVNHHITAFDVVDGRKLRNGRGFAMVSPGMVDGFRIDIHGNLFTSSQDSVQVYASDGSHLGKILVPEKVGNLTFGGPGHERLFIAASSSLYSIDLNTSGVQRP